jgi:hypothetical protein
MDKPQDSKTSQTPLIRTFSNLVGCVRRPKLLDLILSFPSVITHQTFTDRYHLWCVTAESSFLTISLNSDSLTHPTTIEQAQRAIAALERSITEIENAWRL